MLESHDTQYTYDTVDTYDSARDSDRTVPKVINSVVSSYASSYLSLPNPSTNNQTTHELY
jgi:hypothetical protein